MECFHRRRGKKIEQFQKQALLRLASCFKYHTVDNFRSNFYFIKTVNVTNRQIPLNFGVLDDNKNFHLKRVQTMITNPSTIDKKYCPKWWFVNASQKRPLQTDFYKTDQFIPRNTWKTLVFEKLDSS